MITVTRRFEWDAAHRVLGHGGKCRFLHGHRYRAEITVTSPRLDELGMVVDFGAIKEKVGKWIEDNWDHNLLLHPGDPLNAVLGKMDERPPYLMPSGNNPTAENMARNLWCIAQGLLMGDFDVLRVRVWETPSCCADYEPERRDFQNDPSY